METKRGQGWKIKKPEVLDWSLEISTWPREHSFECPSTGICLMFSSWLDGGYMFWGERPQKQIFLLIISSPAYILCTYQHDFSLLMLTLITCWRGFSKVLLLRLPPFSYSLEGNYYVYPPCSIFSEEFSAWIPLSFWSVLEGKSPSLYFNSYTEIFISGIIF